MEIEVGLDIYVLRSEGIHLSFNLHHIYVVTLYCFIFIVENSHSNNALFRLAHRHRLTR